MLVRLASAWTDPFGLAHGAGELVDVDAVTLAELEEQGVVQAMTEPQADHWIQPTSEPKTADPDHWIQPTGTTPDANPDHWIQPTSEPDDSAND